MNQETMQERKRRLADAHEQRMIALRDRAEKQRALRGPVQTRYRGNGFITQRQTEPLRSRPQRKTGKRDAYTWAYGVTTYLPNDGERQWRPVRGNVPNRSDDLLPRTLKSLTLAGFPRPYLFVDNADDPKEWRENFPTCEIVCRYPRIRAFGNWLLGMAELMIREPFADYYAMFQDDMVTCRNLRTYLETVQYPARGYLNLFTAVKNQKHIHGTGGFVPARGWRGYGAVALVFSRDAAVTLMSEPHMTNKTAAPDIIRRHKFIDGGIVEAMNKQGWTEYVHNPSLVQHTGSISTLSNPRHLPALSFMGEEFDCMSLFGEGANGVAQTTNDNGTRERVEGRAEAAAPRT